MQKYENFCKPPNDFLIIVFDKSKISRMMWLCVWFLGTDFFGTEDFFWHGLHGLHGLHGFLRLRLLLFKAQPFTV